MARRYLQVYSLFYLLVDPRSIFSRPNNTVNIFMTLKVPLGSLIPIEACKIKVVKFAHHLGLVPTKQALPFRVFEAATEHQRYQQDNVMIAV